jgi:hypothetical protein
MKKLISSMVAAVMIAGSIMFPALADAEGQQQAGETASHNQGSMGVTNANSSVIAPGGEAVKTVVINDGPKLEGDRVVIEIKGIRSDKAVLVAVSKEDGRLKKIDYDESENLVEGRILQVAAPTTEEYEILLWNSFEEMKPIMPAVTELEGLPVPERRDTSVENEDAYTSSDSSTFMVKDIIPGVDNKGNTIYTVKATVNGGDVEYMTSTVTSLSKSRDDSPLFSSTRRYSYELLWDAVSEREGTATVKFEDIVRPGDVFTAKKDGNTLLYMLKIGDASYIGLNKNVNWSNTGAISQMSSVRDGWTFGGVKKMDYIATDPNVPESVVTIETGLEDNYTFILSAAKKMDVCEITYEVDENNQVNIVEQTITKNAITPEELVFYDEAKGTGDMVLTRVFKRGIRENYVYRFKRVFFRDTSLEEDAYTAEDNSTFMVKGVSPGVDEDGNSVYKVIATTNGLEAEYVTSTVTSLSKSEDSKPIFPSTRRYSYELLWDAVSERDGTATVKFEDIVKPGDVFTAKKDGNTLLYMHKVGDASHIGLNGNVNWINTGKMYQGSLTRDGWTFGQVQSVDIDEIVSVVTGFTENFTLGLDAAKLLDVYEITYEVDGNGKKNIIKQEVAKDAINPQELVPYDEATGNGDMVLTRIFKGGMRENYVYRFIKTSIE